MRNQINHLTGVVESVEKVISQAGNPYGFVRVLVMQQQRTPDGFERRSDTLEFLTLGILATTLDYIRGGDWLTVGFRVQVEETEGQRGGTFRNVKLVADEYLPHNAADINLKSPPVLRLVDGGVNTAYGKLLTEKPIRINKTGDEIVSFNAEVRQEWYARTDDGREYRSETERWPFDSCAEALTAYRHEGDALIHYIVTSHTYETQNGVTRIGHDLFANHVEDLSDEAMPPAEAEPVAAPPAEDPFADTFEDPFA